MIQIILALTLLAIGFFAHEYGNTTAVVTQTIGMLWLLYGIPKYANTIITTKFPKFGLLVKGGEPYNEISALPKRVIAVGAYALFLVAFGLAAVIAVYFGIQAIR
jgi:hypothetical protein